MKRMTAWICALIAAAMLAGCGSSAASSADVASSTPAASSAVSSAESGAVSKPFSAPDETASQTAEQQDLENLLNLVNDDTRIGTAGSSLTAARIAAAMMDWCARTRLSVEDVKKVTISWLAQLGQDMQADFAEKLSSIEDARQNLMTREDGAGLLETAGCTDSQYPWEGVSTAPIEAILEAVGIV